MTRPVQSKMCIRDRSSAQRQILDRHHRVIGDDSRGHTGLRKLAGRGGREVPQLRLRAVAQERTGKDTHVLLGELVRNQTALRAVHNHIIQAEFRLSLIHIS